MIPISNELPTDVFFSAPQIRLAPLSGPSIPWDSLTSPEIKLVVIHKPGRTPNPRNPASLRVLPIPRDSQIGGWRLKSVMVVQLRWSRREWLATTWLEGMAEYGTAESEHEAIMDLVVSLGEYRESLEKREKELGESAFRELEHLRNLIERSSSN